MRAIVFTKNGGPETLELRDVPVPEPAAGEVRVKVERAGFNFRDILIREGRYSYGMEEGQPFGIEAVGRIDKVGEGVAPTRVGERVVLWNPKDGGYAEFFTGPAENAWPVGDAEPGTALGALAQGLTAEFLLHHREPQAGQWALVHAAAGGVGEWLVHLLKTRGVHVIGTASSEAKRQTILAKGADLAIEPTPEAIRALTEPVDLIYHTIGGLFDAGMEKLAPRGVVLLYGAADGIVPSLDAQTIWSGSRGVLGFGVYDFTNAEPDGGRAAFESLLQRGFRPEVATYPLVEAAQAHRDVADRKTQGKVLFTVS